MNGRVPLNTEEAVFASWLATLDNPDHAPTLRAEALKRLAEMYLHSRQNEAELAKALEAERIENGQLRAYRKKVAELTVEAMPKSSLAFVVESPVRAPGQDRPATLVPCRLVPSAGPNNNQGANR